MHVLTLILDDLLLFFSERWQDEMRQDDGFQRKRATKERDDV